MKKINVSEYNLSKVQENAAQAFDDLPKDYPVLNNHTVSATIGTGDSAVNHGLGRKLVGWIVVGKNANATVWESETANPRPSDQIILKATAEVKVTLYFF